MQHGPKGSCDLAGRCPRREKHDESGQALSPSKAIMLWLTLSCSVGRTALPTNVLGRKQDRGPSPRRPPTLTTDILDGLAVAFCIVLLFGRCSMSYSTTSPIPFPLQGSRQHKRWGEMTIITVPSGREWRTGDEDVRA